MLSKLRTNGANLDRRVSTDKMRRFAYEYVVDHNATQAAIRAGYSRKSARSTGQKLIKNPAILAFIGKIEREAVERSELSTDLVLQRLYEALNWEARDLTDENGILLPPHELPDHVQCQVDTITQRVLKVTSYEDGTTETLVETRYRMVPHGQARDQALRHLGLMEPEQHLHLHESGPILGRDFYDKLSEPPEQDGVELIEGKFLELDESLNKPPKKKKKKRRKRAKPKRRSDD